MSLISGLSLFIISHRKCWTKDCCKIRVLYFNSLPEFSLSRHGPGPRPYPGPTTKPSRDPEFRSSSLSYSFFPYSPEPSGVTG